MTFVEPVNQKIAQHSKNWWKSSKICRGNMSSIPSSRLQCRIYHPKRVLDTNNPWLSYLRGLPCQQNQWLYCTELQLLTQLLVVSLPQIGLQSAWRKNLSFMWEVPIHLCLSIDIMKSQQMLPYTSEFCHSPIAVCVILHSSNRHHLWPIQVLQPFKILVQRHPYLNIWNNETKPPIIRLIVLYYVYAIIACFDSSANYKSVCLELNEAESEWLNRSVRLFRSKWLNR